MKKTLCASIAVITMLILTIGCSSTPEMADKDFFNTVMYDFTSAKTVDFERITTYTITLESDDLPEPQVEDFISISAIVADETDSKNPTIQSYQRADILGSFVEVDALLYENASYVSMDFGDGDVQKLKMMVPPTEAEAMIQESYYIITSEDTENLVINKSEDSTTFSYSIKQEDFPEHYDTYDLLVLAMGVEVGTPNSITIDYIHNVYELDKNNKVISKTSDSSLKVDTGWSIVPVLVHTESIYYSYGEPVSFNYPNFDEYEEY